MTVELVKDGNPSRAAFAWPEQPEDLSPWGGQQEDDGIKKSREEMSRIYKEQLGDDENERPPDDLDKIRRQAVRLRRERKQATEEKSQDEQAEEEVDKRSIKRRLKLLEIG